MSSPLILATWSFALPGVQGALDAPSCLEDPLDACEFVCSVAERDERVDSVGFGGLPDASGHMSLDAMVMRSPAQSGAVCCVQHHLEVTRLARRVMDDTPHMMLAGEAADRFAHRQGLTESELLAPGARAAWFEWNRTGRGLQRLPEAGLRPRDAGAGAPGALFSSDQTQVSEEDPEGRWTHHDTIGVLAMSADGRCAGACSTSGVPFKLPGRVGDSPLIGQGLYVEPGCGMAVCTGEGELIMGTCAAHAAVECLRRGMSPQDAARIVLERIDLSFELEKHHQVGIIVCTSEGAHCTAAIRDGFRSVVGDLKEARVEEPHFILHPGT